MHERQWNELGEAACYFLQRTCAHNVLGPTKRVFNRAKHDGDVGLQASFVRNLMTVQPFFGVDLVGANDVANVVVQNFCCGSWQRCKASFLQTSDVAKQRFAQALCAFGYFKRGESVHVHVGNSIFHCTRDVYVIVTVEVGVNTTLQRYFGCT